MTVRVVVRLPAVLRGDAGGARSLEIALPAEPSDGAKLDDLFAAIARQHPRLERRVRDEQGRVRRFVNVFVDGEECARQASSVRLRDGCEVTILPSVAGG